MYSLDDLAIANILKLSDVGIYDLERLRSFNEYVDKGFSDNASFKQMASIAFDYNIIIQDFYFLYNKEYLSCEDLDELKKLGKDLNIKQNFLTLHYKKNKNKVFMNATQLSSFLATLSLDELLFNKKSEQYLNVVGEQWLFVVKDSDLANEEEIRKIGTQIIKETCSVIGKNYEDTILLNVVTKEYELLKMIYDQFGKNGLENYRDFSFNYFKFGKRVHPIVYLYGYLDRNKHLQISNGNSDLFLELWNSDLVKKIGFANLVKVLDSYYCCGKDLINYLNDDSSELVRLFETDIDDEYKERMLNSMAKRIRK